MAGSDQVFAIHEIEFVKVDGQPKAIGLKMMSGPGKNDRQHLFLATKETLELLARRCAEQAGKMPASPAGMA
jgi:hypothetical protein